MKKCILLPLVLLAISSFGQTKKNAEPAVIFTVDKIPTYSDEFIYLFKKNHNNKPDFTQAKVDEYLNLFINFKLKIREARQRGYDTTTKFKQELNTYRDDLKKPYRAEKDVLDKLTHEAYDHLTQEVNASHILIQVKPDASPEDTLKAFNKISEIRNRIIDGEDFEKLARELSEDPSAKTNGGSLGYFTALQMVYPFEQAAYQTKVGEISSVIRTRFGYHIIKVFDKKKSRGEVEVSHILLRSKPEDEKVKNKIFEIYDQLKSGRKWEDLCKEYSEDTNTKNNGGKLRPFGLNSVYATVPEFFNMAFELKNPGDISDPFQSHIGWHIIRLEKKIPIPSYAEAEPLLKKQVARDERVKISELEAAAKRKKDLGFVENADSKKKVLALADSSLIKGKWKFKGNEEIKKLVLFSLGKNNFTVADYFGWIEKNQRPSKLTPNAYMNQLYDSYAEEKISDAEDQNIIKQNPDFQHLMSEYREGILLFEIMEKEIWNKASDDTVGQKKFYNENIEKFKAGPRVEARIFSTTDKSFLNEINKKISNRDSITKADLKKFKSVQSFRNYEKGDSKAVDKIDWVPGVHQTEIDGVYYLVDVARLVAPGTKLFEESRTQVISGYQDSLEKNWIKELKKKYSVKVNEKVKKATLDELLKQ